MKAAKTGHLSRRGLLNVLGTVVLACTITVQAKAPLPTQTLPVIALQALPKEGQETYRNIRKGGPFPMKRTGLFLATGNAYCRARTVGSTVNTPSGHPVRATGVPGALCVVAMNCVTRRPAITPLTTTRVSV